VLVTCYPFYFVGSASDRFIVHAPESAIFVTRQKGTVPFLQSDQNSKAIVVERLRRTRQDSPAELTRRAINSDQFSAA
jgi:hypothetical protein